jgi:hypothetical protein
VFIYFLSAQFIKLTFSKYACYILFQRKINIFNIFICVSLGFETISSLKIIKKKVVKGESKNIMRV